MESTVDTVSLETLRAQPLCVLVVAKSARQVAQLEEALTRERAVADVCGVHRLDEAKRLLQNAYFDAAVVSDARLDGTSLDLLQHLMKENMQMPIVVLAGDEADPDVLRVMREGLCQVMLTAEDASHLRMLPLKVMEAVHRHMKQRPMTEEEKEQSRLLETIRATAATLKHEINNPLAIILGNAQLLLELAHYNDLDPDLVQSIQDIEEASRRIASSIDKLATLKELVTRAYVKGGEGLIDLTREPGRASPSQSFASS